MGDLKTIPIIVISLQNGIAMTFFVSLILKDNGKCRNLTMGLVLLIFEDKQIHRQLSSFATVVFVC